MNQREILTIGMLTAFAFASIVAVKPVAADNSIGVSDDDAVGQQNAAKIAQDADNDVVISGIGNTATAASSQTASASQSNTNNDDDVQTVDVTQTDNDVEAGGDIALPLP